MPWDQLLERQCGVVSRAQCRQYGLTDAALDWRLERASWRRVHRGTYVTHTGPVDPRARCWAALLASGDGAALGHETAAWLWGLARWHEPLRVSVPNGRKVELLEGVVVTRTRRLEAVRHPVSRLLCTAVEETVLDLVNEAEDLPRVLSVVSGAVQKRATNARSLREAAARRRRLRWRLELEAVLADVKAGAETPLEIAYLRQVELGHGLPVGRRQTKARIDGRRAWLDVFYDAYALVVELDGRLGHADAEGRFRDMRRDNAAVEAGSAPLRYGWVDVLTSPCATAAQVGRVLRRQGWAGTARPCGPRCELRPESSLSR
jgi:very-short-patch-repair endonuclease